MMKLENAVVQDTSPATNKEIALLFGGISGSVEGAEWPVKAVTRRLDEQATKPIELDMGMGSRLEGFRICGHR